MVDGPPQRGSFDRLAIVLLVLIGLYVGLAPDSLGWGYIASDGRFEIRVLRVLVGFLFLFVAAGVLGRNRQRRRLDEVFEALNMLLYGRSYKRDRAAISILIDGLGSKDESVRARSFVHLKKLTGQDFALDPEVWRSWWAVHEKHFARKSKRPPE